MQPFASEKRLYKALLDPTNYRMILTLGKVYPSALTVSELDSMIGLAWSPTKRRISLLEEQSLVRRLVQHNRQRKEVPYAAASRALFEWGVIEELLSQPDGTQRLALGLERSFFYHNIPVQKEKLRSLASLTAEFVRLHYFDELRDEVFSPILMKHAVAPVDVAIFFVREFLRNGLYVKRFSARPSAELGEREVRHLFQDLKKQLLTERDAEKLKKIASIQLP